MNQTNCELQCAMLHDWYILDVGVFGTVQDTWTIKEPLNRSNHTRRVFAQIPANHEYARVVLDALNTALEVSRRKAEQVSP